MTLTLSASLQKSRTDHPTWHHPLLICHVFPPNLPLRPPHIIITSTIFSLPSSLSLSPFNPFPTHSVSRAAAKMPYCDVGTQHHSSPPSSSAAVAPADAVHLYNDLKIYYRTYGRGPTKVLLIIGTLSSTTASSSSFIFS